MPKIIERTLLFFIFLVPFIPFVVFDDTFFPYITGKALIFRLIVMFLSILWLLLIYFNQTYRPKKNIVFYSFVSFIFIIFIADIFGLNQDNSLYSRFERMEGFILLIYLFLYFVIISSILKSDRLWRYFLNTNIIASLLMISNALLQFFGFIKTHQGEGRLDGTLGNSAYLGVYMLFGIFISIYLLINNNNFRYKIFYLISILLHIFILFNTGTRSAILGLICGLFTSAILIVYFEDKKSLYRKISLVFISLLVVSSFLFFILKDFNFIKNNQVLSRISSISLTDTTVVSRLMIWDIALKGFKESPVLGYGQDNFIYVFNKNYNPKMYDQEPWFDRAHNVFLDWLIAGGIFGLISYLSLFISALYLIWYKDSSFRLLDKIFLTGLLIAYFINNLFVFDNLISYILFFTILSLIVFKSNPQKYLYNEVGKSLLKILIPIFIIMIIFLSFKINIPIYKQGNSLVRAIHIVVQNPDGTYASPHRNGPIDNLNYYKEALSYDINSNWEVRQQLISTTQTLKNIGYKGEVYDSFMKLVDEEFKKQLEKDPLNATAYFIYSQHLLINEQYDKSLEMILSAKKLSPLKTDFHIIESQIYFRKGDLDKAIEIAKNAYNIEKGNSRTWRWYEVLLLESGNIIEFQNLLFESIYLGKSERSISLINELIKLEPDNPDLRILKAGIFKINGNIDEFNNEIQYIKSDFPDRIDKLNSTFNM